MKDDLTKIEEIYAALPKGPYQECGLERGGCECGLIWDLSTDEAVFCADTDATGQTGEQVRKNAHNLVAVLNAFPNLLARVRSAEAKLAELEGK